MRIAIGQFAELDEEILRFGEQLGASGVVVNTPDLAGPPWRAGDLEALRERCEAHGLRLEAIENVPTAHYRDAMLGGAGRDRAVADYQETIRALGEARVEVLGFHWMPCDVARTSEAAAVGRGGARVTLFDADAYPEAEPAYGGPYADEQLWAALGDFLHDVVPVAEEAGVRLALHPDDPPVRALDGMPRVLRSVDALERALALYPSPSFALDLCLGTLSEGSGDPLEAIRRFGERDQIAYVHFRDVQGVAPSFRECFLGEGNYDPAAALRALRDVGFDGFVIDDHVPSLEGDPDIDKGWAFRGHAHGTGYLQGLLAAVSSERPA
jgi:mannonate dehydratase